ncbi:10154_t:CDS:2, partial [Diversispora eburnea]
NSIRKHYLSSIFEQYYKQLYEIFCGFYSEEHELESNETIENIMSIFNDRNKTDSIFSLIEARIQQLEIYLTYGTTATNFGNEINNVLSKYNIELSNFIPIF